MEKYKIMPIIMTTTICVTLIAGILIGRSTYTYSFQRNTVPAEKSATQPESIGKININTADVDDFMILDGIGPTIAERIVDHRSNHGPFEKIEDIMNVKGIGKVTFSKIADYITTGG